VHFDWQRGWKSHRGLVHLAALGRCQLRHGSRRMGGALGALLARTSLSVKEWGSDPDEKPDTLLLAEAKAVGAMLLIVYMLVGIEAIPRVYRWLVSLFGAAS